MLFDRGRVMNATLDLLLENPDLSDVQIVEELRAKKIEIDRIGRTIIHHSTETRKALRQGIDFLESMAERGNISFEQCVVRNLIHGVEFEDRSGFPKGKVTVETKFPLALELTVDNEEDYMALTQTTIMRVPLGYSFGDREIYSDVGGTFLPDSRGYIYLDSREKFSIPIIVLFVPKTKSSFTAVDQQQHERNHSLNRILIGSFQDLQDKVPDKENPMVNIRYWGCLFDFHGLLSLACQLRDQWEENQPHDGSRELDENIEKIVSASLSSVKNELLADLTGSDKTMAHYRNTLIDPATFSKYNPIRLAFWEGGLLEKYWSRYVGEMRKNTDPVIEMQNRYCGYESVHYWTRLWQKRMIGLRFVMAQIPTQDWNEVFGESSVINEEWTMFFGLHGDMSLVIDCGGETKKWFGFELTTEETDLLDQIRGIRDQLETVVYNRSDRLLLDAFEGFRRRVDPLLDRFRLINPKRSDLFRQYQLYEERWRRVELRAEIRAQEEGDNSILQRTSDALYSIQDQLNNKLTLEEPNLSLFLDAISQVDRCEVK